MIIKLSEAPKTIFFRDRPEQAEIVESQFGRDEFRHSVRLDGADGLLYLPADAQAILERLEAPARTYIQCAKTKRAGKNAYSFGISEADQRSGTPPPHPQHFADPDDYATPQQTRQTTHQAQALRQQEALAQHVTQGATALAPQAQTPAPRPAARPIAPATQLNIQSAAVCMDLNRPEAKKMASALFNVIDALAVGQQYAAQRGLSITFTSEDVRAFSISAYIELNKREGRA